MSMDDETINNSPLKNKTNESLVVDQEGTKLLGLDKFRCADDHNTFETLTNVVDENSVHFDENSNQQKQQQEEDSNENRSETNSAKPSQFGLSRIKSIMKLDPDLSLTSKDSVFLISKATVCLFNFINNI
jgi:hypothetical protein